jgi:hypothetical protein
MRSVNHRFFLSHSAKNRAFLGQVPDEVAVIGMEHRGMPPDDTTGGSARPWSIHCCLLSPRDWRYGSPPPRLHLATPWFHLAVALWPSGRFARLVGYDPDDESQDPASLPTQWRWTDVRRHRG